MLQNKKHMKRCSTSSVIEMQTKTTMKDHTTCKLATLNYVNKSAGEDVEQVKFSHKLLGECKLFQSLVNRHYPEKLKICIS